MIPLKRVPLPNDFQKEIDFGIEMIEQLRTSIREFIYLRPSLIRNGNLVYDYSKAMVDHYTLNGNIKLKYDPHTRHLVAKLTTPKYTLEYTHTGCVMECLLVIRDAPDASNLLEHAGRIIKSRSGYHVTHGTYDSENQTFAVGLLIY